MGGQGGGQVDRRWTAGGQEVEVGYFGHGKLRLWLAQNGWRAITTCLAWHMKSKRKTAYIYRTGMPITVEYS